MPQSALDAVRGVPNACEVMPNIITGGQPTADQLRALNAAGGAIVLDIRDPMEPRSIDEPAVAAAEGLEYVNIPVASGTLNDEMLERILGVLRGARNRPVFFHCNSGNRVGGAMIPYLMLDGGMEEEDAVTEAMRMGLRSPEYLEWGLSYAHRHSAT